MQIHKPAYRVPLDIYIYARTPSLKHKRVLRDRCRCKHMGGSLRLQINWETNEYLIASLDGCQKRASRFRYAFKYLASNYFYSRGKCIPLSVPKNTSSFPYFQIPVSSRTKLDQGLVVVIVIVAVVVVVYDRSPISKRKALNTKFRPREEINRPETRVGRNLHLRYQFTIKLRWIWPEPMANHM